MDDLKCNEYNKTFSIKESLIKHIQIKHKKQDDRVAAHGRNMNKIPLILGVVLVGVFAFGYWVYSSVAGPGHFDDFAKCLTENNVTFFGTFWCPNCEEQKAMFGKSVKYVNYVECSTPDRRGQTQACIDSGIESYPTWEFRDGKRQSGALPLRTLSELSDCPL